MILAVVLKELAELAARAPVCKHLRRGRRVMRESISERIAQVTLSHHDGVR